MFLVESEDDYVRFHSVQAIGFGVALIAAYGAVFFVQILGSAILENIPLLGILWGLLTVLLWPIVWMVGFAGWAFLTYKAYQGEWYRLPVIGPFAAKQ